MTDKNEDQIQIKEMRSKIQDKIENALPEDFKGRVDEKLTKVTEEALELRTIDEPMAKRLIEAFLFSASRPVLIKEIKRLLSGYENAQIKKIILELKEEYDQDERSFRIKEIAGGYELSTLEQYYQFLKKTDAVKKSRLASPAALETLAILSYKQPVTRHEIEEIRGVDVSGVLSTLLEHKLVRISGRKEVPGRPLLYSTTEQFLEHFGLSSIKDLPKIQEIREIIDSSIKREELMAKEKLQKQQEEIQRKKDESEAKVKQFQEEQVEVQEKFDEISSQVDEIKVLSKDQLEKSVAPPAVEEEQSTQKEEEVEPEEAPSSEFAPDIDKFKESSEREDDNESEQA